MDTATLNAYETRAAEFAARYGAADLAPLHRLLLAHLPPAGRLLEIGCGTGREAAFLAEHGFTVIATDASAAMLDQVRRAAGVPCTDYPNAKGCYAPVLQLLPAAFPLPAGHPLLAAYSAYKSGHALNNQILRVLLEDRTAWDIVTFEEDASTPPAVAQLFDLALN